MKIGFAKRNITPPVGTELGGYAGYRPCAGSHDPLWCKAVVLEQQEGRYALVVLDLMCVDESLYLAVAREVAALGISKERLIVSAIHSHASPQGGIPGEGPLSRVNSGDLQDVEGFRHYMDTVVTAAGEACAQAVESLEPFQVRYARGASPAVGSERHTGAKPQGELTALQMRTDSGKTLIVYHFPCHPTVLSAANLQSSADFVGGIEELLDVDMAVFVNGAAGDISTRFTRRESSFEECGRMAEMAARQVRAVLEGLPYEKPSPLKGFHTHIELKPRKIDPVEYAQAQLDETTARWKQAEAAGADGAVVRILKSYAEGALVNLQFAHTMTGIQVLRLPVTVFRFCGMEFATVPGELYSALQPRNVSVIGYANGYYRYICAEEAYRAGHYEALAAIIARGEGERLVEQLRQLLRQLRDA